MADLALFREWFRYALMDYGVASQLQSFHPLPIEIICYHCQQAAEKALKSVLAYHGEDIPYIHDTLRLWKLATALEPNLSPIMLQSSRLADFAIVTRYPNKLELNEKDMKEALDDAKTVVEAIEVLLNDAGDSENSTSSL